MSNIDNYSEKIFEDIKHLTKDGMEYWYARELQTILEYSEWRNFKNTIEKARQLINNGLSNGEISDSIKVVDIGSNAVREIIDYKLDKIAVKLVNSLAYNKLNKGALIRNETTILSMIQKYCKAKNIEFESQFKIENYKYDCIVGNKLLIEFDEQHHIGKKQKSIDVLKEKLAREKGYIIQRFDILSDIIDIILNIEEYEYLFDESKYTLKDFYDSILFDSTTNYDLFESWGYRGLYNGLSKKEVALKKGLKKNQKILDHMGSTELAANLFRATQTDDKLRRENIKGKDNANKTHYEVGAKVRQTIGELGGTMPENLSIYKKSVKQIEKEHKKKELETD